MSEKPPPDLAHAPAWAARLRVLTPARVGLGRTGISLETRDLLEFQRCHALARDAVHGQLQAASLAATLAAICGTEAVRLHSAAPDRTTYLQRPDLGRGLSEASRSLLAEQEVDAPRSDGPAKPLKLAFIVADGLSALAVERHAAPLLKELIPLLDGWQLVPLCVVEQARVAIGDEIGSALGANISVVLIGERPGLSSADSLGAYITWEPLIGKTDAERNCISNIRDGGMSYSQAAAQLVYYLTEARRRQLTGIALKEEPRLLKEG